MAKYKSYRAKDISEFADMLNKIENSFELFHVEKWEHAGKNGYEFIIKQEQ